MSAVEEAIVLATFTNAGEQIAELLSGSSYSVRAVCLSVTEVLSRLELLRPSLIVVDTRVRPELASEVRSGAGDILVVEISGRLDREDLGTDEMRVAIQRACQAALAARAAQTCEVGLAAAPLGDRECLAAAAAARALDERLCAMTAHVDLIEQGLLTRSGQRAAARALRRLGEEATAVNARLRRLLGGSRPVPVSCDLTQLLAQEVRRLRETLPATVELRVSAPGEALPVAIVPGALSLAVGELVENAVSACRVHGAVQITLRREAVAAGAGGLGYAMLEVADSGPGLTMAARAHLREPLFTTRGLEGGRGVGLSAVQEIVDRHGATAEIFSEHGRGTSARLRFPLVPAPETRATPKRPY